MSDSAASEPRQQRSETFSRLVGLMRASATEEHDWDAVEPGTTTESLGFDSLSILDLLYDVEHEFGVEIEAEEVVEAKTLGDVVRLLEERGAG
ncbi:MAG: hypothetical protein DWQ36_18585 [Acidobacteria bacterium]|nr:MAG: hypothetical protein DWQ30_11445 [Acidobacteriota bacterium]REK03877.1 MAG: hypothetical protein DWQ36_18585 [Acidobacteriota bacterium]